jgi:hypothetical protein
MSTEMTRKQGRELEFQKNRVNYRWQGNARSDSDAA